MTTETIIEFQGEKYKYIGEVNEKNKPHGHGVLYYANNNIKYTGEWKNGKFHGWGKLYYPSGEAECYATWVNGGRLKPVNESPVPVKTIVVEDDVWCVYCGNGVYLYKTEGGEWYEGKVELTENKPIDCAMTVGELKNQLHDLGDNAKIVFSYEKPESFLQQKLDNLYKVFTGQILTAFKQNEKHDCAFFHDGLYWLDRHNNNSKKKICDWDHGKPLSEQTDYTKLCIAKILGFSFFKVIN